MKDAGFEADCQATLGDEIFPEIRLYPTLKSETPMGGIVGEAYSVAWYGIAIAAMCYPLVTAGLSCFVSSFFRVPVWQLRFEQVVLIGIISLFAMFFGFVWGTLVSGVVGAVMATIDASLGSLIRPRTAVLILGGLTGFGATFPVLIGFADRPFELLFILLITLLAMIMGHVGALKSATMSDRTKFGPPPKLKPKSQFQIRHLLIGTTWIAAIVGVDQLGSHFVFLSSIGLAILLQSLLLACDWIWLKLGALLRARGGLSQASKI